MKHTALEQELNNRIHKRRWILAAVCGVFLVIALVFTLLYEQSRVVTEIGWGPFQYQHTEYNDNYLWGILVGVLGLTLPGSFLIGDCLYSKVRTVEVNGDYITLYRGAGHVNLYVNGEQKDSLSLFGYHLEASLSDRTNVYVALGKWSAHLTFSNGHPPIDL